MMNRFYSLSLRGAGLYALSLFAATSLFLGGCIRDRQIGGEGGEGGSLSSSGDASVSGSSGGQLPTPDFDGVFNLPGTVDEVNLSIGPQGTFCWTIYGCDFGYGEGGTWRADGEHLLLLPGAGQTTFSWMSEVSFKRQVEQIRLGKGTNPGELTAQGTWVDDGTQVGQTWKDGRMCAICGQLGPIRLEACAGPLPADSCKP